MAQLQGARLNNARIEGTNLSEAYLWQSMGAGADPFEVNLMPSESTWGPYYKTDRRSAELPWDLAAFEHLRTLLSALPASKRREEALKGIEALNCSDSMAVSCNPESVQFLTAEFDSWRDRLLAASADDTTFRRAVARTLRKLVCPGDENTVFIVHGRGFDDRLEAAGAEALPLLADLADQSGKACPVAAQLTDADRAKLAEVKMKVAREP